LGAGDAGTPKARHEDRTGNHRIQLKYESGFVAKITFWLQFCIISDFHGKSLYSRSEFEAYTYKRHYLQLLSEFFFFNPLAQYLPSYQNIFMKLAIYN
jgi:hypothetical protein